METSHKLQISTMFIRLTFDVFGYFVDNITGRLYEALFFIYYLHRASEDV